MDVKLQPKLKFIGVDIINVAVNVIKAFNQQEKPAINISIVPKVFYPQDRKQEFTIIIELKVDSEEYFDISIVACGGFVLDTQTSEPDAKLFIDVNAPAIMFPYVRSFLSTLTTNIGSNFPPIILPPHIFQGELEIYSSESNEEIEN